jgi:hypothetical protein
LGAHANVFACESFMDEIAARPRLGSCGISLKPTGQIRAPRRWFKLSADQVNWLEHRQSLSHKEGWGLALVMHATKAKALIALWWPK